VLAFSLKHPDDFLTLKLWDVIGSTNESLTVWCEDTQQPLYFALEQFVKGVHHALVRDSKDNTAPLKYLAQTDILRFLLADPTALPHLEVLLVQPVEIMATRTVVPVYLSTPLTEAIALLVEHSALPVVNEAGACLSEIGCVMLCLWSGCC
jgi:CBS domain-containing protein